MANKKVAIIEDDLFIRRLYKNKLSQAGYEVMEADDGEAGLELIKNNKQDLVLLDITMPRMNGFELLGELRKLSDFAGTKVIFLTNEDKPSDYDMATNLQADGYMIKAQVLPSEVLNRVRMLIG